MNKNRILAVCQRGNSRSVALALILREYQGFNNVINIGVDTVAPDTLLMLCQWADRICIVGEADLKDRIPPQFSYKNVWFDVGNDVWANPRNKELLRILTLKFTELKDKLL